MNINSIVMDMPRLSNDQSAPLNFKEGDIISARVAQVKGEMVLLILDSKAPLQCRTAREMALKEGQQLNLIVKNIVDNKVELEIGEKEQLINNQIRTLLSQESTDTLNSSMKIARLLIENGIPVTRENLEVVMNTMRSIKYLLQNFEQIGRMSFSEEIDITRIDVEQIARRMLEQDNENLTASGNIKSQTEKLFMYKESIARISPEDVVRLMKMGIKPTPFNLDFVKNFREYSGFLKPLLKNILDYLSKNHEKVNTEKIFQESPVKDVEFVSLSRLLELAGKNKKINLGIGSTVRTVCEKAIRLNEIFREENIFLLPFLFDRKMQEAIILVDEKKNQNAEELENSSQFCIITGTEFLGELKVVVKKENRNISCKFFTQSDDVSQIILQEKENLVDGLQKWDYRLINFGCKKVKKEMDFIKEKYFDMWV